MKISVKSLLIGVLALTASAASAQTYEAKDGTIYEFQKHWYLDLEGGAQYTLGEAKFRRLVRPNVQIALGRQFNPWLSVRLQANGWESRGGWNMDGFTKAYSINYVAPGLDAIVNLSTLIAGYNPTRVFNLSAFLGAGANIAFDNDDVNKIANGMTTDEKKLYDLEYLWDGSKVSPFGRAGLMASFRLTDAVSLLIEGNANLLTDKYNSKKAGNADWYFNALAGLRINLGKSFTKTVPAPVVPEPVPEPTPYVEPEPAPAPAPVVVETVEPLRRDIFFLINKIDIRPEEAQKVRDIADYLKKYPEAKVVVTGYADAGTGNDKINDRLAAQRADAVVKSLQNDYNISATRISYDSKGARVQPFAENDKNRVSVCIAE